MPLNLPIAFAAGLLGFFSPCILPLIPGYLSFVCGLSLTELEAGDPRYRGKVLGATAIFVLGFAVIFTALGASASLAGSFVLSNRDLLSRVGGAVVILFGLAVLGVVSVPGLARERRVLITRRPTGWLGVLLVGMAFGFAWTPCVGPILGAILTLAATTERAGGGAVLLFVYSLGLGLPFLCAAAFLAAATRVFRAARRYAHALEVVSGVFLVVMGTALLFDWVYRFNSWILQVVPIRPLL
ncbi:MAG TPA: cytochrome c biogenesis protein CcdA [bacterium]|nr:cytochrome c biogenesis protein CcdA [bacterium]